MASSMSFQSSVFDDYFSGSNTMFLTTICITGAAATLIAAFFFGDRFYNSGSSGNNGTTAPKTSKLSPFEAQSSKIKDVIEFYEKEYKQGIITLIENYNHTKEKDQYQRNYYNEMLLKLLIKLDDIDLTIFEGEVKTQLKQKRKEAIKLLQADIKSLDKLNH